MVWLESLLDSGMVDLCFLLIVVAFVVFLLWFMRRFSKRVRRFIDCVVLRQEENQKHRSQLRKIQIGSTVVSSVQITVSAPGDLRMHSVWARVLVFGSSDSLPASHVVSRS